ncbi:hypothetical protein [Kitasatospora sp. NPDC097691]|uniref:hypothetical protein n=1 Tax=Kitasatospora sp. NPDC097691 TaxID=3157231 RepID=UPI0033300EB2
MAATPPPRRRPGAVAVATLAGLVVVLALAALAFGRAAPGGLQDQGPARTITPPPVHRPLWPDLATPPAPAPSPTGTGGTTAQAPQPVPDLTVPGRDITAVDVRTVLAKDPGVTQEERQALDSCAGCEVRSPEFRDLTGDGRLSLITTVITPGPVVLHVYTLALTEDRLLPVLRVQVQRTFSAETAGSDLWLYESTSLYVLTSSCYHWDGVRLVLQERNDKGLGVLPPTGVDPGPPTPTATPKSAASPGGRPAVGSPATGSPEPAPGAAVPSPRAPRTTAQPSAQPSAPAVFPEPKR